MYSPQAVANFFIDKANEEGITLTQLKLLKLVYIGYGWIAAFTGNKLFKDEIEAWTHGPVVPSLYHEFKHFGKNAIDCNSVLFDLDSENFETTPRIPESDENTNLVLNYVWDVYKHISAWSLRELTHQPQTPWKITYDRSGRGSEIDFDLISEHFKRKIKEYLGEPERREPDKSVARPAS